MLRVGKGFDSGVPAAKSCPRCHAAYSSDFSVCPQDGSPLQEVGEWRPGGLVAGRFRVISRVGEGSTGIVFKAERLIHGQVLALKLLHKAVAQDENLVQALSQAAHSVRALNHPAAVRLEEVDRDGGRIFTVMEYVPGDSLGQIIRKTFPLSLPRALDVLDQLCSVLHFAHSLGMVHQDIRPASVLLVPQASGRDWVKVLKFGMASFRESVAKQGLKVSGVIKTNGGYVCGTPRYMSPEQAAGQSGNSLDGRSDVYALGVLLYELLTGEPPFNAASLQDLLLHHLHTRPTSPLKRRPDLKFPEPLVEIAMRALEKDPAERFQSAAEMALALREARDLVEKEVQVKRTHPVPSKGSLARIVPLPAVRAQDASESVAAPSPPKQQSSNPSPASGGQARSGESATPRAGADGQAAGTSLGEDARLEGRASEIDPALPGAPAPSRKARHGTEGIGCPELAELDIGLQAEASALPPAPVPPLDAVQLAPSPRSGSEVVASEPSVPQEAPVHDPTGSASEGVPAEVPETVSMLQAAASEARVPLPLLDVPSAPRSDQLPDSRAVGGALKAESSKGQAAGLPKKPVVQGSARVQTASPLPRLPRKKVAADGWRDEGPAPLQRPALVEGSWVRAALFAAVFVAAGLVGSWLAYRRNLAVSSPASADGSVRSEEVGLPVPSPPSASGLRSTESPSEGKPLAGEGAASKVVVGSAPSNTLKADPGRVVPGRELSPAAKAQLRDQLVVAGFFMERGDYFAALESFEAALKLDPANRAAQVGKAQALRALDSQRKGGAPVEPR